jgi:hypothetical protein
MGHFSHSDPGAEFQFIDNARRSLKSSLLKSRNTNLPEDSEFIYNTFLSKTVLYGKLPTFLVSVNLFLLSIVFQMIFYTYSKIIAPNVPAVCDVLAARIRKCVAFPGPTKCGWSVAWEWSIAQ